MLIDTQRIEDFLKTHNCHIINKEQTLEDKVTYADFVTNRYESVFKQLQTDIEVEKAYDALEDVLFIENKDGNLVLAKPYEFTINEKIYSYEAGTPREPIWEDMFKLHSKGAEFTYSTEFEDINYKTVEMNDNKKTSYMNILNNQDLKKKYDSGEIRILDNIMSKYMNGKTVFVIDNEEERDILAYNIARFPYTGIIPEYNSNKPYWFKNNDIACSNFKTIPFEFQFMIYTDFSTILEQSKYKSMCFKDKKIAEYGYEFNNNNKIWSDTTEIYKMDNDNLFIKKYETGYTEEIKYSTISLNNLIKEIQQFKEDKGKDRRGGCFIIKNLPNEYYKVTEKLNTNSYIKNFCDGTIAIKINSQKELDELIKTIQDKVDCSSWNVNKYYSDYPYYFVNGNNFINSVKDIKDLPYTYRCVKDNCNFITDYIDFKDIKTMDLNNNEELDNDIELD